MQLAKRRVDRYPLSFRADGSEADAGLSSVSALAEELSPTGHVQVVEELTSGAVSRTYTFGFQRISQEQLMNKASEHRASTRARRYRSLAGHSGTSVDRWERDAAFILSRLERNSCVPNLPQDERNPAARLFESGGCSGGCWFRTFVRSHAKRCSLIWLCKLL